MEKPKYRRVLLKISGEALAGDKHFGLDFGVLGDADRLALAETLDASIERMASAYALYDYGVWTPILDSIFYESLYGIGKAVLDGTYRRRTRTRYGERKKKSNEEAL